MEIEYRKRIQDVFNRIEVAFESVDPDIAECEQSMGSFTITLADQSRCILSAQPSVQQLWLAVASRGTAYHFTYDEAKHAWMDDKGRGIEILEFLGTYLSEATRAQVKL